MKRKAATTVTSLQDLAGLAGVSRATASRALNDSPLISERTKQKLRALADKHNYIINRQARDLRLRRSSVISVIFMLDIKSEQHMSDPFFLEMLGGIADSLAEHDYDLLLAHAPVSDVLALKGSRVMRHSDGVIFVGQGEQHAGLNELAQGNTPLVAWGGRMPDKKYVLVGSDNAAGAYAATKHLLNLGRQRILFFGKTANPELSARYSGYKKALRAHGKVVDPELKVDVPFEMQKAREVAMDVAASNLDFDAVVCTSDVMALAAISAFTQLGLRVPHDIAVIGYDDIGLAAFSSPALTTVRQNIRWAGRVLVNSVLGLINGEKVTDTILASELIVRQSCGADLSGPEPNRPFRPQMVRA